MPGQEEARRNAPAAASQMATPMVRTHGVDPDHTTMRPARATTRPPYPTRSAQTAIRQCPLRCSSADSFTSQTEPLLQMATRSRVFQQRSRLPRYAVTIDRGWNDAAKGFEHHPPVLSGSGMRLLGRQSAPNSCLPSTAPWGGPGIESPYLHRVVRITTSSLVRRYVCARFCNRRKRRCSNPTSAWENVHFKPSVHESGSGSRDGKSDGFAVDSVDAGDFNQADSRPLPIRPRSRRRLKVGRTALP